MSTLYEVSSLIALVMNRPNAFSQVIGILTKGTTIDIISISGNYAYFKYNNTDAYVKKNNLKIINTQPIEVKGSVILKYLEINTQNEVYTSETINNLTLGTYKYDAKSIYGYKIENSTSQSVTLTESNPNQTITFYYSKILGTVTINYIDENTNASIYQPTVIENLTLGTYNYGSISISGYSLNDIPTKSATLTEASPKATITFRYKEILGSVVVKYINNSSLSNLLPQETFTNLKLGTYTYSSKYISGCSLVSNSTQTVTLTDTTPNAEIIFKYNELLGSVTIKYIDSSSSKELEPSTVISNLPLGTYSYTAKSFEGYNLSDESTKSVTLSDTNFNAIVAFSYSKILGSVTIKYIDKSSLIEISPSKVIDKLELGSYSYDAISIDGYSISGDTIKTVILTSTNLNQVITFSYSKILGEVIIRYIEEGTDIDISEKTIYENLELGTYKYSAKSIDGYNVDMLEQSITITATTPKATIIFSYSEILGNITIKYLDSSSLAEIAPSTTISNIVLGDYTYDAITIDGYEVVSDSSISITLTSAEPNRTISFKYNKIQVEIPADLNWNEVPYISTYYIKPVVEPGEEVFIDYYITDYYYKEYMEKYNLKEDNWGDDNWTEEVWNNETFTVTVRVEGQEDKLYHNLKAGDHQVSLGSFAIEGEQKFSILCTDKYGRNSHELFNFFLVRKPIVWNEYIMTEEDLKTYNIKNTDDYEQKVYVKVDKLTDTTVGTKIEEIANDTIVPSKKYICFIGTTETDINGNPIMQTKAARFWLNTIVKYANDYDKNAVLTEATNTRIGLQKLLDDKKASGYNRLLLLPGIYRIDHQGTIYIPTNFTLDLNKAILKQNQFTGASSLIISLDSTFDSHVINGTIEGDYFSHDYSNSTNNSEWCIGGTISGCSKYSSIENIIIKDITGYGASNGISSKNGYYYFAQAIGNVFTFGDINLKTGESIDSAIRQTTSFIDISKYLEYGYVAFNRYLGYQGMIGGSWNLIIHFYNINKDYIKSTSAFQYRRLRIPKDSKYIKITILSATASSDFWMVYFKVPCHCSFKNIEFNNCRCVGLAQAAMNDMLVENCEFTLSGQSGAFCAYDAEDGWDQMQDVSFKSLNFHNNSRNDFLTCAGHNFIVDNQKNGNIYIWERTRSVIIKNCLNTNITLQSGGLTSIVKHGIYRVFSNSFTGGTVANNLSKNITSSHPLSGIISNSILLNLSSNSIYSNCIINVSNQFIGYLGKLTLKNCDLIPITTFNDRYKISFNGGHTNSYSFENCNFYGKSSLANHGSFYCDSFIGCYFEDVNIFPHVNANKDDLIYFENCSINYSQNNLIYYSPYTYSIGTFSQIKFINCSITNIDKNTKSIIYAYAIPNGYCNFINCIFIIPENSLILDGYVNSLNLITSYTILINNSKLPDNIITIKNNNNNIKINII